MHRVWLAVAACVVACSETAAPTISSTTPRPTASTADQDALWALAPETTTVGVIATPKALASVEAVWVVLRTLGKTTPDIAAFITELESELGLGTFATVADLGLTTHKGFALFETTAGTVLVLPVANRDTFLRVTHGSKGTDSDTVLGHSCRTIKDVYACASPISLLDTLGTGRNLSTKMSLAEARGDIEVAGTIDTLSFALATQIDRGAAVFRWGLKGAPTEVTTRLSDRFRPRTKPDVTAGFGVLDVRPFVRALPLPLVPGVTLDQLASTLAGPILISTDAGSSVIDASVQLSDSRPAQRLIDQCATIPGLQATVKNGVCSASVLDGRMALDLWIENDELRLGKKGAPPTTARAPLPARGKELAAEDWAFVFYGHGLALGAPQGSTSPMISALTELGLGARMDGDTLRGVATVRTLWTYRDDVVAKLLEINSHGADAVAKLDALARTSKDAAFTADHAAGWTATTLASMGFGIFASLAVPTVMDSMKKSNKRPEASTNLDLMARHLKTLAELDGHFPKGTAPVSPSASCCAFPHAKCNDPSVWKHPMWIAIGFEMEQPHLFRYEYASSDGKSFVAKAVGDLDCDGVEVAWTLTGTLDAQGQMTTSITPPLPNTD